MLRFASALSPEEYQEHLNAPAPAIWTPRYNLSPTQFTPILRATNSGERFVTIARWGLIPPGARTLATATRWRLTHAHAEHAAESATYAHAFQTQRCLIPVSAYYTWVPSADRPLPDHRRRTSKQPHAVRRRDQKPLVLAGLWERWTRNGRTIDSFAFLTVPASLDVAHLDQRMPAILLSRDWNAWLSSETSPDTLQDFLHPYPAGLLESYPVTRDLGNLRLDDARLLRPVA